MPRDQQPLVPSRIMMERVPLNCKSKETFSFKLHLVRYLVIGTRKFNLLKKIWKTWGWRVGWIWEELRGTVAEYGQTHWRHVWNSQRMYKKYPQDKHWPWRQYQERSPEVLLSHMSCYRSVSCTVHAEPASPGNWRVVSPGRQSSFLTGLTAYVYTPMIAHLLIFSFVPCLLPERPWSGWQNKTKT